MLKRLRHNVTGDTIVEVLLALSILGLVLGGAYVIVNKSTLNERRAQERNQALQLAQGQIEYLKQYASVSDISKVGSSQFCINVPTSSTNLIVNDGTSGNTADCLVNSSGLATTVQPQFHLIDQLKGSVTSCTPNLSCVYKIEVDWTDVDGSTQDSLTLFYKLYS